MRIKHVLESGRYGNLARVAIDFHVKTGRPAELDAAVAYTRAAVHFAQLANDQPVHDTPVHQYERKCAVYSDAHLID